MNENDFAELSAGFALGALSPDDERAYHAALAEHPEWQSIATADAETAAALAEGAPAAAPPLDLRSKLLSAIAASENADVEATAPGAAPDVAPAAEQAPVAPRLATGSPETEMLQTVERRNWSRGLFALVASITLLVGIGWGAGALSTLWQAPAAVTALEQIEQAPDASSADTTFDGGSATVHWSESVGKVVLVAEGLPSIDRDQTYELWFVRGDTPVAAGTFTAKDGASTAQLTGTMQPGDTIAVTVEQAGGSPTGTPTSDPILAVSTA